MPEPSVSPPTNAPRLQGHLPILDGIRGLAIVLVVFNHIGSVVQPPYQHTGDWLFAKLSGSAWLGVDLFFVLSGFLITGILADTRAGPHYFRTFYLRRALRIFPLYYAFLLVVFVLLPLFGYHLAAHADEAGQAWYWAYGSNILFAWRDAIPVPTGHLWSLSVEEQFYLVWPLVVLLIPPRVLARTCVAIVGVLAVGRVALAAAGASWVQLYVLTPTRVDALAIGAFIALSARTPGGFARLQRVATPTAWVTGVLSLLVMFYKPLLAFARGVPVASVNASILPHDLEIQTLRFSLYGLFFGAMLVRALAAPAAAPSARFFGSTWMRGFGRYSYALYLFHVPVHALAERYGFAGEFLPRVAGWQIPRALFFYVLLLAVSTLLALASWHLFEKHFLRLKDRFSYQRPARAVTPAGEPGARLEADREIFASP